MLFKKANSWMKTKCNLKRWNAFTEARNCLKSEHWHLTRLHFPFDQSHLNARKAISRSPSLSVSLSLSLSLFLSLSTFLRIKPNATVEKSFIHRHLREIDCSSAIVGGPVSPWAMALNMGVNQCTGPAFSTKACFMVAGDITTSVNKGRQAGPTSCLLI